MEPPYADGEAMPISYTDGENKPVPIRTAYPASSMAVQASTHISLKISIPIHRLLYKAVMQFSIL
jgi:hypothetical protein